MTRLTISAPTHLFSLLRAVSLVISLPFYYFILKSDISTRYLTGYLLCVILRLDFSIINISLYRKSILVYFRVIQCDLDPR